MGRSTKERSNPSLGKPHKAGAKVNVVQVLAHDRFGAIAYLWPRHWLYHYFYARDAATELTALHGQVLEIEPGDDGMRLVSDHDLLQAVYRAGNALVSNAVRTIQHLAEEIERAHETKLRTITAEERIIEALAFFSTKTYNSDPDYAGLSEINGIRDALEHPQGSNTYNGDLNGWDKVPLAWMLSNRSLDAWRRFDRWVTGIAVDWEAYQPKLATGPVVFTVRRGIESQLQVKKPPRKT
jgi:hypothetical protein